MIKVVSVISIEIALSQNDWAHWIGVGLTGREEPSGLGTIEEVEMKADEKAPFASVISEGLVRPILPLVGTELSRLQVLDWSEGSVCKGAPDI
ncbi:MAG: hypothetical protein E7231_17795 [Cellulosilyticum sp.]|nr:hypothetical protein [Cellulosilyticum sp.]